MDKNNQELGAGGRKRWIVAFIAISIAILASGIWYLGRSGMEQEGYLGPDSRIGPAALTNIAHPRTAPDLEVKSSDGKGHRLSEFKGNAIVLHFWASWCPPCLGEIPQWLEFADQWKGRPVRFVAVSLDQSWDDALKVLPMQKLPSNVVSFLDQDQKMPEQFGTYQYPETYLIDPSMKIVSKWVGPQEWSKKEIAQTIEHVLRAGR